ncbi:GyrI-like domain-containing protein [Spirilliplanes yamanashiensis]|uniref:AraC effector-binding domain-containing protein n=1 Tax=Spirilliplanes yamanashiensis TaxID=42233 RepID=A0A8J3Y897_9ACTN|nr:GyrI-like domain-containing protein [Spirilliplanes yamanashiensis]MDP9817262.1 effector-binding domain-containing protein [Spirilliplanes yamanashiensis]GIJ03085.1 hypothetical protein Sya03_24370 [Spirilliplanes yamanashiensis]
MEIQERTVDARVVVGIREMVPIADLSAFFERAMPAVAAELGRAGLTADGPPLSVYHQRDPEDFEVTVGFPVERAPAAAPARLAVEELPAGPTVQAVHEGPYDTLPVTYAALGDWLSEHDRKYGDTMWEEYLVGPDATVDALRWRTRVVFPLD